MATSCLTYTVKNVLGIETGPEMSSKRISHKKLLELAKKELWKTEVMALAEQYCPEMLDEVITSEADIAPWIDRFLDKLPEDKRQRFSND